MIWRLRLGRWRFTFTLAPITEVVGVNSILPDGNHILMWDFDDVPFPEVRNELEEVQAERLLPRIYILNSGKPNHYIAYCFTKVPWRKAVEIIISTKGVDWAYIKFAIIRGTFTLRVTPKSGRTPKLRRILESNIPEDTYITELRNWVQYETLPDNYKGTIRSLTVTKEGVHYRKA